MSNILEDLATRTGETLDEETQRILDTRPTLKALADLTSQEARVEMVQRQVGLLAEHEVAQRRELRRRYFEPLDLRFADVSWKRAVSGAREEYPIILEGVATYFISVPSGQRSRDVAAMEGLSEIETIVLSWLSAVQLEGHDRVDLSQPPAKVLPQVRQISTTFLAHIADSAQTLQSWLNWKLEESLGNS